MPVIQELVDYKEILNSLPFEPIIVNDLQMETEEDREVVQSLIRTKYQSDMIPTIPSCRCGAMMGERRIGMICPECDSAVESKIDPHSEPLLWLRNPKGVRPLISPIIWIMLKSRFTKSGFSVMNWLCDVNYRSNSSKQPDVIDKLTRADVVRGYNFFYDNFDRIMEILFSSKDMSCKRNTDYLKLLIETYRDKLFFDHIALPNKSIIIIEKTNVGTYLGKPIGDAMNAMLILMGIDTQTHFTDKERQNRVIKAIDGLATFLSTTKKNFIASKAGVFRKNIFATRTYFTFRAVISSITKPHHREEIWIPWGVALSVFRPMLLNRLSKLGMTINEGVDFLHAHAEVYCDTLDKILNDLINEAPYLGIPVIEQRNPSLLNGSAQLKYITVVKKDPKDRTVGTSILTVRAPNAIKLAT